MELKRIIFLFFITFYSTNLNADLVKPREDFKPFDVVNIKK